MPKKVVDPLYHMTLALVRRSIVDALIGDEMNELVWLFSPPAQVALQRVMDLSEENTLAATRQTVEWVMEMVEGGQGDYLRHLISQRAHFVLQRWREDDQGDGLIT